MLTDNEKRSAKELCCLLPNDEVMSLARTVTKDQLVLRTIEEAVDAILAYTISAVELLRRKKMKRDVLFQYLYNEGIVIAPNADKSTIARRVLKHWGSATTSEDDMSMEGEEDDYPVETTLTRNQFPNMNTGGQNNGQMPTSGQTYNSWQNNGLHSTEEDQDLALQFSKWFYEMLNACNPIYLNHISASERFGPHHFLHDASLSILFFDKEVCQRDDISQADAVCKRLSSLTSEKQLVFNPNLTPTGVKGLSDPHGLRVVIVCGTVHTSSEVVGPFEQQFGLIRDPFSENNWKIKFTRLAVSTARVPGLPTLDVTRQILST